MLSYIPLFGFFSAVMIVSGLTIEVCQNKNCCKAFKGKSADLVQTLRQITDYDIEATGCLSRCSDGPNIRTTSISKDGQRVVERGIDSAHVAAAVLELNDEHLVIHPMLLAACQVMEKAEGATTRAEKERNLNSVIAALSKIEELAESKCMAHALIMRAQSVLDFDSNDDDLLRSAREDILSASLLDPHHSTVWRVMADIEVALGQAPHAIQALHRWAQYQPQFATKVNREIEQITNEASVFRGKVPN